MKCTVCGGPLVLLGTLGRRRHYRCQDCGLDQSETAGPVARDWLITNVVSGAVMGIYSAETAAAALVAMHDDAGAVGVMDAAGLALDAGDWTAREVTDHLARSSPDGELYVCRLDDTGLAVAEAAGPLAHGELPDALAGDWDNDPTTADWLEGRFIDGAAVLLSRDEESAVVVSWPAI